MPRSGGDASIVLVGRELLTGYTRDANGHFLAKRLFPFGIRCRRMLVLDDVVEEIAAAVAAESRSFPWVLVAGGLGATHDDVTTEAVAKAFGLPLEEHPEALRHLDTAFAWMHRKGIVASPHVEPGSRKMALVPRGARWLPNRAGLAIGYCVAPRPAARVLVMPGVPRELEAVFVDGVEPLLQEAGFSPPHVAEVVLHGLEHEIAARLAEIQARHPEASIGSYPVYGKREIVLRVIGEKGAAEAAAEECRGLG